MERLEPGSWLSEEAALGSPGVFFYIFIWFPVVEGIEPQQQAGGEPVLRGVD